MEGCTWDVKSSLQFSGSFAFLCLLLYVGVAIRRIALVRLIFLPASLIAGVLGLIIRLIVDQFADNYANDPLCNSKDIFTDNFMSFWGSVPGIAINIIFACLFLGKKVPSMKVAWRGGGPQLMYGQIKAWGSWFWCCIVALIITSCKDGIPDVIASMFCVGFEGGHGTAGGLKDSLGEKYYALAVTSATVGIILGCVLGTLFVNIGSAKGFLHHQIIAKKEGIDYNKDDEYYNDQVQVTPVEWNPDVTEPDTPDYNADGFRTNTPLPLQYGDREASRASLGISSKKKEGLKVRFNKRLKAIPCDILESDARIIAGYQTIRSEAIDSLAYQLVHVGLAIGIGYGIVRLLALIDRTNDTLTEYKLFSSFPLFPMCMLGGILVQLFYDRFSNKKVVDGKIMNFISGTSIEFLCICAIATMNVQASGEEIMFFLFILLTGIVWQISCFWLLAPRLLPDCWFERGIVEFGMGFGTTSIGLLLLRMADPLRQSTAWDSFSYKQMMHEPFMGGGIWTTFAVIFLTTWEGDQDKLHLGIYIILGASSFALIFWFGTYFLYFKNAYKKISAQEAEQVEEREASSSLSVTDLTGEKEM